MSDRPQWPWLAAAGVLLVAGLVHAGYAASLVAVLADWLLTPDPERPELRTPALALGALGLLGSSVAAISSLQGAVRTLAGRRSRNLLVMSAAVAMASVVTMFCFPVSLVALVLVAVLTPVREDRTQGRTWPA